MRGRRGRLAGCPGLGHILKGYESRLYQQDLSGFRCLQMRSKTGVDWKS